MRFTIAIPTYNNVNTIEKSIESAIHQTYNEDFEVLVVDNCSTDGTDKLLDSYNEKITAIRNNTTVSMYENHNICLKHAKGDYIIFCHSDDELLTDALRKYYNILKKRNFPGKYVLWGRSMFRDFKVQWERSSLQLDTVLAGEDLFKVFATGGLTPSGTCFSTDSFRVLNGFYLLESKTAPSDTISYWKLILNQFEFEMSSRIMYKRTEASTASGQNYTKAKRIIAMTEAYAVAFNDDKLYKKYLRKFFKKSTKNYIADISLINLGFYKRRRIILHYMMQAIQSPSISNISKFYNIIRWT